jgi:hypothetical protein
MQLQSTHPGQRGFDVTFKAFGQGFFKPDVKKFEG